MSRVMSFPLHQIVSRISHAVCVVSQDGIEVVVVRVVAASSLFGETANLQDRRVAVINGVQWLVTDQAKGDRVAHTVFRP